MRAIKCERDVDNMKFAQYMEKHINQQFKGVVVNLSNFGCYVQLENTIEGMISLTNLGDDYFNYDEQTNEIRGKNSPIVLRFGTSVMIQVISADKMSRKIDFRLVSLL
jgi:ribonuclease R